jgi:hypothetical protein
MGSHRDRKEGARRIGSSAYLGTLKPLMTARLVVIIITNSLTLSQLNSKRVKLLHSTDLAQTHWFSNVIHSCQMTSFSECVVV